MSFADIFREKYRVALRAARADDEAATLKGLYDLYQVFEAQYSRQNRDSIITKAKLSYWKGVFGGYIDIIRKNGLRDRRVQKFFGLIDDTDLPSLGDLLRGESEGQLPFERPNAPAGDLDVSGLVEPPKAEAEAPIQPIPVSPAAEQPFAPIEPILPVAPDETAPIEPALPVEPVAPQAEGESEPAAEGGSVSFDPDSLETFIGQQHIVKPLLKEIAIAKAQGRCYLDNILLLGNPGLGKSTLMRLIAKALGVRYEWMDCSQYRNSQQSLKALQNFLMKVARENEPVVIAFDEIHMLTEELQSSLLTLLNNRVYVSPPDVNGVIKRIPIDNFTFIAATTDDDQVLNTIKDRCLRLKFQMEDYTPEELKLIYKNKVAAIGLTITDEAIDACIPRSRGSIRYVDAYVKGLNIALYNDEGQRISTNITLDVALGFFEEKGIDAIGLEKKDLEILRVLEADSSGAMGVETLSARIGLDSKKYLSEYEPYLIKIGFVNVSGRGRSLTEAAIKYLKESK